MQDEILGKLIYYRKRSGTPGIRVGKVLDKYVTALASGTNSYVAIDHYLVMKSNGEIDDVFPDDVTGVCLSSEKKYKEFYDEYEKLEKSEDSSEDLARRLIGLSPVRYSDFLAVLKIIDQELYNVILKIRRP